MTRAMLPTSLPAAGQVKSKGARVEPEPDRSFASAPVAEWLAEPMKLLADARSPHNPPRRRLGALGETAAEIDWIFSVRLPQVAQRSRQGDQDAALFIKTLPSFIEPLVQEASATFHEDVKPALAVSQLQIVAIEDLVDAQIDWLRETFMTHIFPLLIPLAVDPGRPFPHIGHGALNLLVELAASESSVFAGGTLYAFVRIPPFLPRLVPVPAVPANAPRVTQWPDDGDSGAFYPRYGVWIEDVAGHFVRKLFPGMGVKATYPFRLLRVSKNVADAEERRPRQPGMGEFGEVARLEVDDSMPQQLVSWLGDHLGAFSEQIQCGPSPLGMADLLAILDALPRRPLNRWMRWIVWWRDLFFGHI